MPISIPECCDNCGDGTGWDLDPVYGWAACADCNDDLAKPKPPPSYKDFADMYPLEVDTN